MSKLFAAPQKTPNSAVGLSGLRPKAFFIIRMILFLNYSLTMLTITSYIGLLIAALVFTLSFYLGLLKVVKLI